MTAGLAALMLWPPLPPGVARAQEPAATTHEAARRCTCRYMGDRLPLGSRICLATPQGPRMAQCGLEENVTSWLVSSESCPTT